MTNLSWFFFKRSASWSRVTHPFRAIRRLLVTAIIHAQIHTKVIHTYTHAHSCMKEEKWKGHGRWNPQAVVVKAPKREKLYSAHATRPPPIDSSFIPHLAQKKKKYKLQNNERKNQNVICLFYFSILLKFMTCILFFFLDNLIWKNEGKLFMIMFLKKFI